MVKLFWIIAIVAIIGFTMAACEEPTPEEPDPKVDIVVANNSIYQSIDATVKAEVFGTAGGTTPLEEKNIPIGQSVTFTMDEGNYRVRIVDGMEYSWWYPSESTVTNMSGTVRLSFTGLSLISQ